MVHFPRSNVWDEATQKHVDQLRAFLYREPQPTISQLQEQSLKVRPLKGPCHLIQDILPAPEEDDVRQLLFQIIRQLGQVEYETPDLAAVPVEWISKRKSEGSDTAVHPPNKRDQLECLVQDTTIDLIILHVHGGALFQGSSEAYRTTTSELAALTGGRIVSVKYRLAPQFLFPTALLDVFVVYLSLLYPAPTSPHRAVKPSRIVFAGDSSGGQLLFGLLQIIKQSSSHAPIRFNGRQLTVPIPFPAGIATLSLQGDSLNCLPSYNANRVNDLYGPTPWSFSDYPSCALWPTDPPRSQVHAENSALAHPFNSVAMAQSWVGAPPMWFAAGTELAIDGAKAVARRAAKQGVKVTWLQFEAMPHCFATLPGFNRTKQARLFMERWAEFCRECVEEPKGQARIIATMVSFKDTKERPIQLENEGEGVDLPLEEVERTIRTAMEQLTRDFEKSWKGSSLPKL